MKIIKKGKEARSALLKGICFTAEAIASTMGPGGRNAVLSRTHLYPLITNDGLTVGQHIELEDECEEQGSLLVKQACKKTNDNAGDGTTTTAVLVRSITEEGLKMIDDEDSLILSSVNAMSVKREIDAACQLVVEELKKTSRPTEGKQDIKNIATVSMESEEYGNMLADIFTEIGKNGAVKVEDSSGFKTTFSITKGAKFECGAVSPYMLTDKGEITLDKVRVLVTNEKISSVDQLAFLQELSKETKELYIFCDSIEQHILQILIKNLIMGTFKVVVVKVDMGNKENLEDIADIVCAKFIDHNLTSLKDTKISHLGYADKITSTSGETTIIGGGGNTSEKVLKLQSETPDSLFDQEKLKQRIARLEGKASVIKIGANSEAEKEYLKLKFEDAVNAIRSAMEEGVVKGGGLALKEIAENLPTNILTEALKRPYQVIQENNGQPLEIREDVIDPTKVTRNALENACSIAGLVITTEVLSVDKREKDDKIE